MRTIIGVPTCQRLAPPLWHQKGAWPDLLVFQYQKLLMLLSFDGYDTHAKELLWD
jgi:hypothetical protein